jgi:translin
VDAQQERDLKAAIEAARSLFDAAHAEREDALRAARATVQLSSRAIRAAHRGEMDAAAELIASARDAIIPAAIATRTRREFFDSGLLHDAEKEYAEGAITIAALSGDALPTAEALGIGPAPYVNGLAEAASELRRSVLDLLRAGNLERAESLLQLMDAVYEELITLDYPDAVTRGLRRTTDQYRSVLERTRSDLTVAARQLALERRLKQAAGERDAD